MAATRTKRPPQSTVDLKPRRPEGGNRRHPWDVLPGTNIDERVGPILFPLAWAGAGSLYRWWAQSFPGGGLLLAILNTGLAVALAAWAWHASHGRKRMMRIHITVSVALQMLFLTGFIVFGWTRPFLDYYWFTQIG